MKKKKAATFRPPDAWEPLYTTWRIPKRNGKFRTIESPNKKLKAKQKALLRELKKTEKVSPFAHAFQPYKNIATMAMHHVGKEWVACVDLEDFFPSIKENLFTRSTFVKTNTTEGVWPEALVYCFHDFDDGKGVRLPQGAPSSPFLSNVYLYQFDWRMAWICYKYGYTYTRYADDIVVSGPKKRKIEQIMEMAEKILTTHYKLNINHRKTKYMHRTRRQMVCGVVVNEKMNIPRKVRKNLRAELYQLGQKGEGIPQETEGRVAFHKMVMLNEKTSNSNMTIMDQISLAKRLRESV